jgi:hypothetical protein
MAVRKLSALPCICFSGPQLQMEMSDLCYLVSYHLQVSVTDTG